MRSADTDPVVRASVAGTVLFGLTAAYAAISFSTAAQWVGAVTALGLFAAGVFAFLISYFRAVGRSRRDEVSVAGLYLLMGDPTPRRIKVTMWLAILAQVLIALLTTLARPDGPDGNPGSSLAVGFLVPMFGIGMNGLWAATNADFPRREVDQVAAGDGSIGQNAEHG